jgi:predicted hotdog family 3-hydroxylacyl-ACP dehydratase
VLKPIDIRRLVPHAGAMCLLDSVQHWDMSHIVCEGVPCRPSHPLAGPGGVSAVAAIEYAAQAAAVHGALREDAQGPRDGMLVKLSAVRLADGVANAEQGRIRVRATLLGSNAAGCMYEFEVSSPPTELARGRLIVAFRT